MFTLSTSLMSLPAHTKNVAEPKASSSTHLTLRYVLRWKGLQGNATYTVDRTRGHYKISSVAEGKGLASILGKATMTSEGEVDAKNTLKPHFFRIDKPFSRRVEQATFNWDKKTVTLRDGNTVELGEFSAHDPLSLLFQFYWNPPKEHLKQITVVTTKKVSTYIFKPAGNERLTFNNTSVDTEVWKRYDATGKLRMTLWLAPAHHYLPIKMHDHDGADEVKELQLTSIDTTP